MALNLVYLFVSQTKYWWEKVVNSTANQWNPDWGEDNDIEIYATHNKGKSNGAGTFFKTFKTKFSNILVRYLKCVYW